MTFCYIGGGRLKKEVLVRVDPKILQKIRGLNPIYQHLKNATLVNLILKQFLEKKEEDKKAGKKED